MQATYQRHDITYKIWEGLEPRFSGREGIQEFTARDNRKFLNAFF